jgi:hypothetical protein
MKHNTITLFVEDNLAQQNRLPIAGPPPPISKRETDGAGTMYSLACSGAGGQLAAIDRHLSNGGSDCASGATASAPCPCDTRKIHQLAPRHRTIPGAHH